MQSRHFATRVGFVIAVVMMAPPIRGAETDVQRQLQLREQQQTELRLRMQQQLDRSSRPMQTPSADLQSRTLERDQQQRLQQFSDQQLRSTLGAVAPGAAAGAATIRQMRRDLENQRALLGAGGLQSGPFGMQTRPFGLQSSPFGQPSPSGQSGPFRPAPPQTLESGSAP